MGHPETKKVERVRVVISVVDGKNSRVVYDGFYESWGSAKRLVRRIGATGYVPTPRKPCSSGHRAVELPHGSLVRYVLVADHPSKPNATLQRAGTMQVGSFDGVP